MARPADDGIYMFLIECQEGDLVQLKGRVRHYKSNDHWYIEFLDGQASALFFENSAKNQIVKVLTETTKL